MGQGGNADTSTRSIVLRSLIITPSGALSPGPLSLSALVAGGSMGWLGGFYLALGHTLFEAPYVALLWTASARAEKLVARYKRGLALATALLIAYFGVLTINVALYGFEEGGFGGLPLDSPLEAILAGVLLTGFNPYFLLWWVSAGYPLVSEASKGGFKGLNVMYVSHVWMDYAWLSFLAATGGLAASHQYLYRALMGFVGVMLLGFAADMIARSWLGRRVLPI